MIKSSRLKRLVATQLRLRTLEQLEHERRRQDLVEAEDARNHALDIVSGADSPVQTWLVARTDAPQRTARRVEAARASMIEQEARLLDRAIVCRLVARLYEEAVLQERAHRDAGELADTLERLVVLGENSAGQD